VGGSALYAVGTRFVHGVTRSDVGIHLGRGERFKNDIGGDGEESFGFEAFVPSQEEADAGDDLMGFPAELEEHGGGVGGGGGFSENGTFECDGGIGGDEEVIGGIIVQGVQHGACFVVGNAADVGFGGFAWERFFGDAWCDAPEGEAELLEHLFAPGRGAGEQDEFGVGRIHG